ncbi:MAG: hypothetical protein EOO90_08435 [Pedobacter sp.]|nr:MAG: hypothetical protein EOO90_08435 [Pedobacter sp.]
MRIILSIVFICINFVAFGQTKPIYFSNGRVVSDSTKANEYGVYGKVTDEGVYVLKRYDLYDNLKSAGSFKDENLEIPHGEFTFYDDVNLFNRLNNTAYDLKGKYRYMFARGSFVDGKQSGSWYMFYPDGNVLSIQTYTNGILNGFFGSYDRKGRNISSGAYKDGKKDGEWSIKKGKVVENYKDGVKQPKKKN